MLSRLPLEIILNVTSNLSFKDKLNLMTTCKRLKTQISELSLYEWLQIQDRNMTESVITKFKDNKFNGVQVKRLELWFDVLPNELYRQLPAIFPNVTQLRNYSDTEGVRDHHAVKEMLKWKDTLEYYDTRHNLFKIGRLIEENTFSRLSHLYLSPYFLLDWRMHQTDLNMIDCISHAPLLKVLELNLCQVNVEFIEKVHSNCPFLHTLSLEKVLLNTSHEEDLLQSVVPANSFRCLRISPDSSICDEDKVFLSYIIKKYPNLIELEFLCSLSEDDLKEFLNKFYIYDSDVDEDNRRIASTLELELNLTNVRYWQGGFKFISRLPKSLKILKVNSSIFDRIRNGLQKAELNLSVLEIDDHDLADTQDAMLGNMKDARFLGSQKSLKTLKIIIDSDVTETCTEVVSFSITDLTLDVLFHEYTNAMDFDWILSKFPSLTKLELQSPRGIIIGINGPHYNLRELTLTQDLIDEEWLTKISTLVPNVKKLSYHFPNLGVGPTKRQFASQTLEQIFSPTDQSFSHVIDVTGFDLDSFSLNYDFERLKMKYNVENNTFTGGSEIDFEIRIKNKTKRFLMPSSQNYITVLEARDNVRRSDLVRIQVLCNNINELIIGDIAVIKHINGDVLLEM